MKRRPCVSEEARSLEKEAREKSHERYLAEQYPLRLREKRLNEAFFAYMATTPGTKESLDAYQVFWERQQEYDGKHTGD
tara:strand:- start:287 stop:523 length:237 start_codon:yes stop_codon:yes gene_type:complete